MILPWPFISSKLFHHRIKFIILSRVAMGAQSSSMPEQAAPAPPTPEQGGEKKKCKACCACPETKRARDECIVAKGEENCKDLIEAHRKCMKEMGFNI